MAKKKFDTNQLDPDFPQQVGAAAPAPQTVPELREQETSVLNGGNVQTRQFDEPALTEEQTRKFNEADFQSYQSPYNGQQIPMNYQPPPAPFFHTEDRSRKVAKIGLPENILTALPYIPLFIGLVAGILELIFVPKSEAKVRFHAAQGVAAHIAIMVITAVLGAIGNVADLADVGNIVFKVVTTIMLIIFAIKAFQGKPIHIESVDDLTNWLEDKIKPSE
jgi:uncharacterized membrane protein